jgi:hypothetical protein
VKRTAVTVGAGVAWTMGGDACVALRPGVRLDRSNLRSRITVGAGVAWTMGGDACVALRPGVRLDRSNLRSRITVGAGVAWTMGGDACVALRPGVRLDRSNLRSRIIVWGDPGGPYTGRFIRAEAESRRREGTRATQGSPPFPSSAPAPTGNGGPWPESPSHSLLCSPYVPLLLSSGAVKKNVVPFPTVLSKSIVPPCCSTISLAIERPRPYPPIFDCCT